MNVIGHLAIGPDLDAEPPAGFAKPIAIERVIAVLEEYALAPVAALGDMMRQPGNDDAGDAGHRRAIAREQQSVKTGVSP
jgi:hypothetical protein